MAEKLLPTSLVGSYPQPDWLLDREKLRGRLPPRVRALELWRIDAKYLGEAQDDATRLAIADQERAGLDILTNGDYHLDPEFAGRSWLHYPLDRIGGLSPDEFLVEMIELYDHPWFVGCQFHPELKSRPTRPHPLFASFIGAAVERASGDTESNEAKEARAAMGAGD